MITPGKEWQMLADLRKQLVFPRETVTTSLQPDIVMWSVVDKRVLLMELSIPWEEGMTAAHERKHLKYSRVPRGWLENRGIGCRGSPTAPWCRSAGVKPAKSREGAGRRLRKQATGYGLEGRYWFGVNTPVKAAAGGGGETYWYRG